MKILSLGKKSFIALVSPPVLISLFGPIMVYVAQGLVKGTMQPAAAMHAEYASALNTDAPRAITLYSIQVYTVVLAFVFWFLAFFSVHRVTAIVSAHRMDEKADPHLRDAAGKIFWYKGVAVVIILLTVILFRQGSDVKFVALYNPSLYTEPGVSFNPLSWIAWLWWWVSAPPIESPITWLRGILAFHGLFLGKFDRWCSIINGKTTS